MIVVVVGIVLVELFIVVVVVIGIGEVRRGGPKTEIVALALGAIGLLKNDNDDN